MSAAVAAEVKILRSHNPEGMKGLTPNDEIGQEKSEMLVVPVDKTEFMSIVAAEIDICDNDE